MSASFLIDAGLKAVFSHASGRMTAADLTDHMDRLLADPRFRPDMRQIIDFRDITGTELSNDEIRSLAQRKIFGPGSKRAFVAPADFMFGLARMFQTYRELNGESGISIFRTMEEAVAWTGLPADAVRKAFEELHGTDNGD